MFTGLIEATGRIDRLDPTGAGLRLRVVTPIAAELTPGDSIAVNGVCLTATTADAEAFTADLSPATLAVTTFGAIEAGRVVNLERPLRADARLGGHFVLGHVDATGRIRSCRAEGDHHWVEVEVPDVLAPYLIHKGSIAIDGISLTIAALTNTSVGVQIVPFTFAHTSLQHARAGDAVNIEADVIGKHVARLIGLRPDLAEAGAAILQRLT